MARLGEHVSDWYRLHVVLPVNKPVIEYNNLFEAQSAVNDLLEER